ncbi:efflux RND transporter periplasmic adaptor subunit [Nitrospira sp. Nam74]
MDLSTALPQLRHDLRFSEQATPEGRLFIVKDPRNDRFFKFREAEHFIARQFDGRTSLEMVAGRAETQLSMAVSTDSLRPFLDHLHRLGLLESPDCQGAMPRNTSVRGDIFALRWKAYDPDRLLNWLVHKVWFCFTPAFVMCSAGLMLFAVGLSIVNGGEIARDLRSLYRVESLFFFWVTIFVATTLHEFAHGLTCKRFGGEVHELGFMLLFFQPAFYCNVSDAWLFPEKWKRLWVSVAGVYFELTLWALCTVVWRVTVAGTWPHTTALIIMATSGLQSLFDMIPLLKLDGYYFLSDLLDVPNLRSRAFRHLRATLAHAMFRRPWAASEIQDATPRERKIYLIYSILAALFSAWLLGSLAWWLGGSLVQRYQGFGFLLFVTLVTAVFRHPLWRAWRSGLVWLKTVPTAIGRLGTSKRPVKVMLLVVVTFAFLVLGRLELTVSGEFRVLPIENADVRAEVPGILEEVFVNEGDFVETRTVIARLADRDYRSELKEVNAQLDEKQARLRLLRVGARPEEIEVARKAVAAAKTRQEQAHKRYDESSQFRTERLARATATVEKSRERLKFAEHNFERVKALFGQGFISKRDSDDVEEQRTVREKELEEAEATLRQVQADTLSEFVKDLATTEKDSHEAQAKLTLVLAGSRQEDIDATRAEIARLEARRDHLEEQLGLLRVIAPHPGVITTPRIKEKVGQLISKGDLIAEVHDLRMIEAEIAMPEQEIADLAVGEAVRLKARGYPSETFSGTVTAIAPAASDRQDLPDSKILRVRTLIENRSMLLRSEMTGNAKIYCGKRSILELLTRRIVRYIRVEFWSWW